MRQLYRRSFVTAIAVFFLSVAGLQAQVGIGTPFRNQTPNSKAVLHLEAEASTPQGFLLPRINRSKFVGLTSSDNGMIVYDQTDNQFYYWLNDRWAPLSSGAAVTRETWTSGLGVPNNTLGTEGDFYFDSITKDLYRKNSSGIYTKLFSLDVDRFWISDNATLNTYTTRNVGIGVAAPTEKLEINGSIVSSALKSTSNQLLLGNSSGKIVPFANASGVLTNDGSGNLTWQTLTIPNYKPGAGISINSDIIKNTGDTDANDDIITTTVADGDVTGVYSNLTIKPNAITGSKLADGAVTASKLLDGSVTELKIADQSITTAKIAPPSYGNMQLVSNAKGQVTWIPSTTATLGAGEIAVGTGTNVNSVVPSQDINLTTSGKVTVLGLLGRTLDNINTPLTNQVLSYNGSQWTYKSIETLATANGDVQGLLSNTTVTALQGRTMSAATPSSGDFLQWSGSQWRPATATFAGDVSGTLTSNTVQQIQSKPLDVSLSSLGVADASKVLTWNGSRWAAQSIPVFTLPNTGNGKILVGNGSSVNSVNMMGDVSLASDGSTQLTNIQGKIISASNPLTNQILKYNGSAWTPSNLLPAGDLDASTNTLLSLQGRTVSATAPSVNNVLTWTGSAWQPQPIPTFTLANTSNGSILVGNGTSVNAVAVSGDLSLANSGSTQLTHIQGQVISAATPSTNQFLKFNGTAWVPAAILPAGDVDATTNSLQKLQGQPVSAVSPSLNNVLTWTGTAWQPQAVPTYTLPNTGSGQILIGNGTSVNTVAVSQDLALATDGKATITGIRGTSISSTAPTTSQVLAYDGTQWAPATLANSVSGDASGSFSAITVDKIKGTSIDAALASAVANDRVLTWDGTKWTAKAVTIPAPVNTASGELAIGQGGSIAAKTISGDVTINSNGQATIQKLATNALDNTVLSGTDVNKVLTWNGTKWIATTVATPTLAGDVTGSASSATVRKLQGATIDASVGSLNILDLNKVLTWDGTKWVAAAPASLFGNASALQSVAISPITPTANQILTYDGTKWIPANAFSMPAGDVNTTTNTVEKIQGVDVSASNPTSGNILYYDGSSWIYKNVSDIMPLSSGKLFIGDATNHMTEQTLSKDLALNSAGQATLVGIQGKAIDVSAATLASADNGKVLTWDGATSKWTPKTPTAAALPALETQTYSAAQTRYYSFDPTEFLTINANSVEITYSGARGSALEPTSGSSTWAAATLHLPHGAIVSNIKFVCYDNKPGKDISFYYTKNDATGSTSDIATASSSGSSGAQTLNASFTDTIDNQNYSYKVVVNLNDNSHQVFGVRVTYTVAKPD